MPEIFNARRAAKELLQGIAPARPLFLPIAFSIGTRIENVPLRSFLSNPTKIVNALRQIRTHLRSDGATCYFDPFLEAEALGATLDWDDAGQHQSLQWPVSSQHGELPENLRATDELPKAGRVPAAVDVITRLRSLLRDDCLLMARVAGPYTLAAMLAQNFDAIAANRDDARISPGAVEFAADAIASIARTFVEAGANAILIHEQVPPSAASEESPDSFAEWVVPFTQTLNIVRFYEALPILILPPVDATTTEAAQRASQDWIVCTLPSTPEADSAASYAQLRGTAFGIAIPPSMCEAANGKWSDAESLLLRSISDLRPAIVTTAGEIPPAADIKRLNRIGDAVRA
jgi:uroporphyrinogen-III decarboxylase